MHPAEIKALRKQLGLTQLQLAQMIHTSKVSVGRWERGENKPQPVFRQALKALEPQT